MLTAGVGTGGWTVGESIAAELDMALTGAGGYLMGEDLPPDIVAFLAAIPDDWLTDWPLFLGGRRRLVNVLEQAAFLAGAVTQSDYSRATLAMRELDGRTALEALRAAFPRSQAVGGPGGATDTGAELVDHMMELLAEAYADAGFPDFAEQVVGRHARDQLQRMVRILKDGDLHTRFWHWLDRFYYQHYLPFRSTRAAQLAEVERNVVAALGSRESATGIPEIGWLPRLNPLNNHEPLTQAVGAGRLRVFFWIEPFGIPDLWSLWPGLVVVSTSQAGDLLDNFRRFAEDVATRVRAVGDPTRLAILRIIRHMGIPNSSIAGYLGLAQPTVSVHARILREAGFIRSRKEGRVVRHEVVPGELERLFRDLDRLLDLDTEAVEVPGASGGSGTPAP
jgi:DNA-binding transcriptional ArsR family regulator